MLFHLDIQTLLVIILVTLLIGIFLGASLARPRYTSPPRSSRYYEE
jgi:uncharacterized protein YneF (UPF0154 family)